jgi:hypothetical protein
MASPSGNQEDKDNKGNIDIPSTTSAFERKMLEYMATQTQTLQPMTQTMVNNHQYIIEQASNPKNPNLVLGDNCQIPSVPPSLDKEKLSVMQAQVVQGQKQTNTSSPKNTKITRTRVSVGPVKKQVVEAWNHQNNKRSHGVRMNEQHEHMKTIGICQCCEHYGRSCLQKEASLMTDEARQCYHLDINKKRKLCTQNAVLEEVAQAVDSNQIINLEDWSITFKAFQPDRIKQLKKHAGEESQDNSIKRMCFRCGKEGHYINNCPTKHKRICLVMMDYIASSVEKMNILLVGEQKKMIINPRIEISIPLLLVKHAVAKILKQ